jgi:hypothetical protein
MQCFERVVALHNDKKVKIPQPNQQVECRLIRIPTRWLSYSSIQR